jgi:hypothetical protein
MIKTIRAVEPEIFDKLVNEFERKCSYSTGASRVFATQTHVNVSVGLPTVYTAVIFYKGDEIEE